MGRVRSTISVVPLVSELPYEPWRERGSILAGEFRWRLGVRPLDLANWIELGPDADGPDGWIAQKAALLGQHASTVFGALDGRSFDILWRYLPSARLLSNQFDVLVFGRHHLSFICF